MKKTTLFLLLLTVSLGYSQVVLEDLEGAAPTIIDDGTTSAVAANPDMAGPNTSANAIQILTNAASNPWQGSKLIMQNNKIDMTTSDKTMDVDVYSTTPREFLAKLSDGDVGGTNLDQESKTYAVHGGTGWETLEFDFNVAGDTSQPGYNPPNDQFSSVIFFPLYDISNNGWCDGCSENNALDTTTYVDNITAVAGDLIGAGGSLTLLEDLEGAAPTLIDDGTTSSVAANPDMAGANTSANAIQILTNAASNPWQGSKLLMQNNKIDMTTAEKSMTVDIYSLAPREFLAKLSDGDVGGTDLAQESKTYAVHGGTGWETLTFDFNVAGDTGQPGYNPPNDQFSSIIFFPLYDISNNGWCDGCSENNSLDTTTYVDNIMGVAGDAIVPPTPDPEAAPIPNAPNGEVYSIYNDTNSYTTVFSVQYPFGTLGGEPDLDPGAGVNKALKFDFTFAGWGQGEGGPDDVSAYGFVNFMYWAEAGVPGFQFRMISNDGAVTEHVYEIGTQEPIVTEQWTQVSIPMSYFTNLGFSSANFFQWKCDPFMQVITDPGGVYIDNIILTQNALSVDEFDTSEFKVYPNPTAVDWTISGNRLITKVTVYDILGKTMSSFSPNANEVIISTRTLRAGMYFAKIESANGSQTVKLIKE